MSNNLLTAGFCLLISLGLSGCSQSRLFLVNTLARLENFQVADNLEYGPESANRLTIYSPESPDQTRPTIIFFYGGCWGGCLTLGREHYVFVAEALTTQGYNVVIPDYRRYPEVGISEIMKDAVAAVEWVSANIHHHQGHPNQIVLMGHSAGAHIAALLTFDERYLSQATYRNIRGFIGLAGPYDFLPFTEDYQKQVFGPVSNYPNTQPVNFVDGNEPPALLLQGQNDTTVKIKNIKSLTRKVKMAGGQVNSYYYDDLDHTDLLGALSKPLRNSQPVLTDIIQFVKNTSFAQLSAPIP